VKPDQLISTGKHGPLSLDGHGLGSDLDHSTNG
jgi:hypothetical protein